MQAVFQILIGFSWLIFCSFGSVSPVFRPSKSGGFFLSFFLAAVMKTKGTAHTMLSIWTNLEMTGALTVSKFSCVAASYSSA